MRNAAVSVIALCAVSWQCAKPETGRIEQSTAALAEAAAPARLKYFGFFFVDVGLDDPHDPEVKSNFSDEIAGFSNIAQMAAYTRTTDLRARIKNMNDRCIKPFVSFQEVLFRQVDKMAPSGHHYQLYDDYRARWATFKTTNATAFTAEKVGAFYLLDEPVWNGVTFAELDAVSQMIKTDFPDIPILLVEAYAALDALKVPTTVDWVGFDRYAVFKPSKSASFLGNIATLKSKLSMPHQRLFLTIDDRWEPLYGKLGVSPAQMDTTIAEYYDLAVSDPMVIGLLGYLWAGGIGGVEELGVRNMPKNILELNKQIGAKIVANDAPCVPLLAPTDAGMPDVRRTDTTASDVGGPDVRAADALIRIAIDSGLDLAPPPSLPPAKPSGGSTTVDASGPTTEAPSASTSTATGCDCHLGHDRAVTGLDLPAAALGIVLVWRLRRKRRAT